MATASDSPAVLIVGGGPTGLILAMTLLLNKIPVRIIDRDVQSRTGSKGNGITPRSQEVYRFLGVLPDIQKYASPQRPLRMYKPPEGRDVAAEMLLVKHDEVTSAMPYPNGITLGQDVLQTVFERYLESHFGVKIERGIELVKFSVPEPEADPITAQLRSSDGSEQDVTCRFLVGADGGHSGVRKALGLSFDGHTIPGTMVYGDVCVEGEGMGLEHWHSWSNPSNGVRIGIWSVSRDPARPRAYRLFGASEEDARAMVADTDFAAKFFASQTGRTDLRLSNWQLTCAKTNVRMAPRFSNLTGPARVFVAGDAAHAHSPAGGQGLNSGIQDAFNLGWKLALVLGAGAAPALLESYSVERAPVIKAVLDRTTAALAKMTQRPLAKGGPGAGGPLSTEDMKQLQDNYRGSPIVLDELASTSQTSDPLGGENAATPETGLRAGDRAPDASGLLGVNSQGGGPSQALTLFDLFRPTCHTVLILTGTGVGISTSAQEVLRAIRTLPQQHAFRSVLVFPSGVKLAEAQELAGYANTADTVLLDVEGHAFASYLPDDRRAGVEGVVTVIRPDGVVGARVRDVQGFHRYTELAFGKQ